MNRGLQGTPHSPAWPLLLYLSFSTQRSLVPQAHKGGLPHQCKIQLHPQCMLVLVDASRTGDAGHSWEPQIQGYFILIISIPGAYQWGATDLVGAWGSEGIPSHQASENGVSAMMSSSSPSSANCRPCDLGQVT